MTGNTDNSALLLEKLDAIAGLLKQLVEKDHPRPQRLMRTEEAASYLHLSKWQVRGLVARGELPVVKVRDNGHSPFLFDKADLDGLIDKSKL